MGKRLVVCGLWHVGRAPSPAAGPLAGLFGSCRPLGRLHATRHTPQANSGQATLEYIIASATLILPLTFALVFTAQLLWVWHSVVDFTREGARYASTHCWMGGDNVVSYMRSHVPLTIDMEQFQNGEVEIQVQYFSRDPTSGVLTEFTCDLGDCSPLCVPDVVTVSVRNYEFRRFMNYLGLPPVSLPDFHTSLPMESVGCNADSGDTACVE